MKKLISIISLVTLLISMGCSESWLDINKDPNNPSTATPEVILPVGVLASGVVTGGYYNLLGGMYSQYWAQSNESSQYRDIDSYNLTTTDFEDQWETLYSGALTDLRTVRNETAKTGSWNLYLQATVMEVYTWQMLVDLYDKIPYFKALDGANGGFIAGYDDGDKIYDDLIIQLDNALSKDFTAATVALSPSQMKQDLIFKSDLTKWIKFANTLKLKIYLRQMYARPTVAQEGINNLFAKNAVFLDGDAKIDVFIDELDKDNPLYASNIRNLNTANNLRSSATLYYYLQANSDPRFAVFCGKGPDKTLAVNPMPQGGYEILSADLNPSSVSLFNLKASTPVYFFTKAEVNFIRAEVAVRYGLGGDPKTLYDAGVRDAFEMYGLNATSFIAPGGVYEYPTAETAEKSQQAIIMQKWLSMTGIQGLEAFLETNRTHYPAVSKVSVDDALYNVGELTYSLSGVTNGLFPKRLLIPNSERSGNSPLPAELSSAKITDKVWWDKK